MSSLMGARDDRKVTPGITELSRLRAHIERLCCEQTLVPKVFISFSLALAIALTFERISTARFATSMSALPILAVQKLPRVGVFTH